MRLLAEDKLSARGLAMLLDKDPDRAEKVEVRGIGTCTVDTTKARAT